MFPTRAEEGRRRRTCCALGVAALALALAGLPASAQSRRGEMRGVGMASGYNRDWPAITKSLKESGFNALLANFSTGRLAYYPSRTLRVAAGGMPGRNELAEAIGAARANGIELHVWRISWALWDAPQEEIALLETAGRLQRNALGQLGRDDAELPPELRVDWLCPSHPENRKLEKEAALEVVRSYEIAGIHFDRMQFPSGSFCFCDRCKARFQHDTKMAISRWPEEVQPGGQHAQQWQAWRRGLITSLVEEINEECHRIKPQAAVSSATWPDTETAYRESGQDWPLWVRKGLVDFICPMDFAGNEDDLLGKLTGQLNQVQGAVPVYVGLGGAQLRSSSQLVEQIEAGREAGADGFVVLADGEELRKWLAELSVTTTAADPNPMPHWAPLSSWSLPGAALLAAEQAASSIAYGKTVLAGQRLEVGLTIGLATPTVPGEGREGAEQAARVLRQAASARPPVSSYEPEITAPSLIRGERPRVSGRVIVERPSGETLLVLGAFEGEMGAPREYRLRAPEGPFRIAVYGTEETKAGRREFVTRSVLLKGAMKQQ